MFASGAARLLSGFALPPGSLAALSSKLTAGGFALLRTCEGWTQPPMLSSLSASFSTHLNSSPGPHPITPTSTTNSSSSNNSNSIGDAGAPHSSPSSPEAAPFAEVSPGDTAAAATAAAASSAAQPGPASRRDKSAAAALVYPSSRDDSLGVQRNWFNALYTQLNVIQRTGMAPHMRGRQREVFEAVEREFEGLWERHVRDKGLQGTAHRGMLMCCLAVATHKVLLYETGDDALVREVVRTNLGGTAVGLMMRLHKLRLWLLLRLLAEDPYKQAVRFLPSLQGDLGSLVAGQVAEVEVEGGRQVATWTAPACAFHSVLVAEGATELLPEFCCQFGMQWLEVFSEYGVRVGLEESLGFGDERCVVRISRPGAGGGGRGGDSSSSSSSSSRSGN